MTVARRQLALWAAPLAPRRPARVLAHMVDCGEFPDGRTCGEFVCPRCGWNSQHVACSSNKLRRGIPCGGGCNPRLEAPQEAA